MEKLYLLIVEAPEIDTLRRKYGLPTAKHPYHITIGVKERIPNAA